MNKNILSALACSLNLLSFLFPQPCGAGSLVEKAKQLRLEKAKLRAEKKLNDNNIFKNKHAKELEIPLEQQLPFTIFIYAHNAGSAVVKNLDSVFKQQYQNYRIIYVDDASTDNTTKKVHNYLATIGTPDNCELITLNEHQGELKIMHSILNTCKDNEIILLLNGQDWLATDTVLNQICKIYSTSDIWLTFGTASSDPKDCNIGIRNGSIPDPILKNRYFRKIFPYMPTRTFYAGLFKQIKKEDLIDPETGDFFEHAAACYIMWPLMEMAHTHFKSLKEITYVVNCNDSIAKLTEDYHLRMACNSQMCKEMPVYQTAIKAY